MRTTILEEQGRQHKGLGINGEVCHGSLSVGKRKRHGSGRVLIGGFFQGGGGLNVEQVVVPSVTSACDSRPLPGDIHFALGAHISRPIDLHLKHFLWI
jgi:hypothetical protein